jgi:SAM-dependent methyltransferase
MVTDPSSQRNNAYAAVERFAVPEVVKMPIDNDVYDREGQGWWEEDNPLNILHGSITPGRFAYFREVLTDQLGADLPILRAVDIGCGGGFLAEEFACLGLQVVGVDPSAVSMFGRHGLQMGEIVGLGPRARKPLMLLNFIRANRGRITYGELSRRLNVGQVKSRRISYMGFATKAG